MELAISARRLAALPAKLAPAPVYDDWVLLRELEARLTASRRVDFAAPRLHRLVAELEPRLAQSLIARRAARGMAKLAARLRSLGKQGPSPLDRIVLLLEAADDLTVRLIHPECGWRGRFHLVGIESNRHLFEEIMPLLARSLGRSLSGNPFLGRHERDADGSPLFRCPFALYANADICRILDADIRLESPDRIWNAGTPRDFPVIDGVPTAFLGIPPQPSEWTRGRLFPEMVGRVEMLDS